MSKENVEFVRGVYAAVDRGDEKVWDLVAPEFVMDASHRQIEPMVLRGRNQVRDYVNRGREAWEEGTNRWEPKELVDADDKVVAFVRTSGKGKESGAQVEAHVAHVWTFRDGNPVEVKYFGEDQAAALEAAGLKKPDDGR
jgi:ketosteroid isomerase-like protein